MQIQIDAGGVDLRQEGDEVLEGPAQAIDAPRHDDVELSPGGIAVHRVELGSLVSPFAPEMP